MNKIGKFIFGGLTDVYEDALQIAVKAMKKHADLLAKESESAAEKAVELQSESKQKLLESKEAKAKENAVRARIAKLEGML